MLPLSLFTLIAYKDLNLFFRQIFRIHMLMYVVEAFDKEQIQLKSLLILNGFARLNSIYQMISLAIKED